MLDTNAASYTANVTENTDAIASSEYYRINIMKT